MHETPQKKIVILGASYAGISVSHHLLQHVLPTLLSPDSYKITLISPSSTVLCRPACPRAMLSDTYFEQSKLFVDIDAQLTGYPKQQWEVVRGLARGVDLKARTVMISRVRTAVGGEGREAAGSRNEEEGEEEQEEILHFHALVIATGSSIPSPLLSLPLSPTHSLQFRWANLRSALPTAKSIVIAGGGPTGVEVAGELAFHLSPPRVSSWLPFTTTTTTTTKNPPTERKVKITLVSTTATVLPSLRPSIGRDAETYLRALGVEIIANARVVGTSPSSGTAVETIATPTTVRLSNGETVEADIYIPAYGTTANTSFLAGESVVTASGHVRTDASLRVKDGDGRVVERVYAIGDVSDVARPAIHNVLAAVPVLSGNIRRDLVREAGGEVDGEDEVFVEDVSETQLVPVGRTKGVGAFKGWRMPSWVVWVIKGRDYWVWTTGRLWSGKQWR